MLVSLFRLCLTFSCMRETGTGACRGRPRKRRACTSCFVAFIPTPHFELSLHNPEQPPELGRGPIWGPYQTLNAALHKIWILELAPGDFNDPLMMTLHVKKLDEHPLEYHALSYIRVSIAWIAVLY